MTTTFRSVELAGAMALSGRDQILQMPFKAGVTHVEGKYGFTQGNYLLEGANRIFNFGADAIFVYLHWNFASAYPQKNNGPFWPATSPASLVVLAQTAPFQALFNMPFTLFVLTTYGMQNHDNVAGFTANPNAAVAEEQEFYDLTKYLFSTYAGTGKTFILKHWEGDFIGLQGFDTSKDIAPNMVDAMNLWLSARQRGVSRGRTDSGNPAGIGVFHAVEMSRVLDYTDSGMTRVVNAVIPVVKPDMVTYSSYDSSKPGTTAAAVNADMNRALNTIKSLAPDPLGLGDKRILISEYGLFENSHTVDDVTWRTNTILQTSQAAGILGAFMWQVFDNECYEDFPTNKVPFPVDCTQGTSPYPNDNQCLGLWLVRPDGTIGPVEPLISPYFQPSTSGVTLTGRITSASGGAGIGNAVIAFYGGQATADANGNYSLTNVPPGPTPVQLTASAANFQNFSQMVTVSATQNPTINFSLTPSTAPGTVSGKIISAVDGSVLSGVTVTYSGGSTQSNSSGAFSFSAVPGGTYNFTAQLTGWVSETIAVNIQPGITAVLDLRLATGGKLTGQVNNSSGAGVAGATVNAHGGDVFTNVTITTNSSGAFDFGWLPVGDYYLVVTAQGYVQNNPGNAKVTLTTGNVSSTTLILNPTADFSLSVTPSTATVTGGQPATFTIQLNPLSGFNSPVSLSVTGQPSNATASFNPATISSGTSTLTVTTSLTTPAGSYVLTIQGTSGGLQHTTHTTLTVSAAPGAATGKVTNAASGAAIAGAKVSFGSTSTTTDANGNYTLSNLPAGSDQLTASASGFLNTVQTVTITSGGITTANFVLITQTGTISGRITNASTGAGLSGATVSYSGGSTVSDANGNYTLSAVPPGTYTVTATLTGWVTESTSVTVISGGTVTGNIKLATGGKAAGKVTNKSGGAISGATVKLTGGVVPTTVTVTTNSSGSYDSGWVPIGNYSIQVSKSGFTTQTKNTTVTTGATITVNFTLQ
jgi:carboxypeptidase family protein